MTLIDKYRQLVERLYARTMNKTINWSLDDNKVYTRVGSNEIYLTEGRDFNGEPSEVVTLKRLNGDIIESFDDVAILGDTPKVGNFESYWKLMTALREIASRQAVGADDALDEILGELDDDTPF